MEQLKIGFGKWPPRCADRHRCFVVDHRPAPPEERHRYMGEIENALDQLRRLHLGIAERGVAGKGFPSDIFDHWGALGRLEAARRAAQPLVAGKRRDLKGTSNNTMNP